jgi:acyl dehydratase
MSPRHLEDFHIGDRYELGSWSVGEDEVIAFAEQWDPQYFQLDPERAVDGPFGGLVASGSHTSLI